MASKALSIGDKAPGFNLLGVDGRYYSLESFSNKKVLVVIFSCNHCPYVKDYEDRMIGIQRDYADRGVQLVAINSNDDMKYPEDSYEEMIVRAKEKKFNFPYLRDADQSVAKAYGPVCTPEVFVFDEKRTLRYHGSIDDNRNRDLVTTHYLREALDALLQGRDPPTPETRPFGCSIKWKYPEA